MKRSSYPPRPDSIRPVQSRSDPIPSESLALLPTGAAIRVTITDEEKSKKGPKQRLSLLEYIVSNST